MVYLSPNDNVRTKAMSLVGYIKSPTLQWHSNVFPQYFLSSPSSPSSPASLQTMEDKNAHWEQLQPWVMALGSLGPRLRSQIYRGI
jgi:hypothetical protein